MKVFSIREKSNFFFFNKFTVNVLTGACTLPKSRCGQNKISKTKIALKHNSALNYDFQSLFQYIFE